MSKKLLKVWITFLWTIFQNLGFTPAREAFFTVFSATLLLPSNRDASCHDYGVINSLKRLRWTKYFFSCSTFSEMNQIWNIINGNIKKTIKTPSKFLLISVPPTMSHKSSRSKKNQMIICKKVKRLLCTEHTCLVYGFFLFLFFVLLICFFLFHRFCFNLNNSHLIRVHFQINSSHIESFIEKPKKYSDFVEITWKVTDLQA